VGCIHVTQYMDQWQTVVNTANKPSGSIKGGEFLEYGVS
jgi:hypothetical protein